MPSSASSSDLARAPSLFLRRLSASEERGSLPDSQDGDAEPSSSLSLVPKFSKDSQSPKRLNICGFVPLPPITASPICTPTPSTCSRSELFEPAAHTPSSQTSPTDPISCSNPRVLSETSTPIWIATPPTPPSKPLRRSNTTRSIRRSHFTPFSPSTSFPASMHPHAVSAPTKSTLRRSSSVPTLPAIPMPSPNPIVSSMYAHFVQCPTMMAYAPAANPFEATFTLDGRIGPLMTRRKTRSGPPNTDISHLRSSAFDNAVEAGYHDHPTLSQDDPSMEGSWSDHSVEDIWEAERNKDSIRRFHALKELLSTEANYLVDLQLLVTVYLRNLPTLAIRSTAPSSTFGRASASFNNASWINSSIHPQVTATGTSSTTLAEPASVSASSSFLKSGSRYVFSDQELELLTRNAEELLSLHEQFVRELREVSEPLGYTLEGDSDTCTAEQVSSLDAVIRAVSTKFATEASRFNSYQSFCAGHPEAMDILRTAVQRSPLEMDVFEQRCSALVSDLLDPPKRATIPCVRPQSARSSTESPTPNRSPSRTSEERKRAMSLTSLDNTVQSLRPRPSMNLANTVVFPTEIKRDRPARKIAFMDYMIKPIQRICKYPLLLDQLLPSKAVRTLSQKAEDGRSAVDVVVESAAQAMRHVATSVDEARHRQDIAVQSALILSRMVLGLQMIAASNSPYGQAMTTDFLLSLGTCLLSGSLDVMQYDPCKPLGQTSNVKVKYYGAFLYSGGYLILVKTSKGRKYEPRHWFSLGDFHVSDVDTDALLPCSFRLSSGDQHFELAAACQREKETWLSSIHESLTHNPGWTNEPTPSFRFDEKGEVLPEAHDCPELPSTTGSYSAQPIMDDVDGSGPFFASLRGSKAKKRQRLYDTIPNTKKDLPVPPSRRPSGASVKNIFSPMSSDNETVVIRRSSPMARHQVDQELQDVISQSCLAARSYAFSQEVELFQAPLSKKYSSSRSNSGMGMGRLSRHESVRVLRRRMTESTDSLSARNTPVNKAVSCRRPVRKLSITSVSMVEGDGSASSRDTSTAGASPCPSPPSSSVSSSSRVTTVRSSEAGTPTTPTTPVSLTSETTPVKSRSFVRNVKGFFHFRPASPQSVVAVVVTEPIDNPIESPVSTPEQPSMSPYSALQRWTKESLRRRSKSVPEEPESQSYPFSQPEKPLLFAPARGTTAPLLT